MRESRRMRAGRGLLTAGVVLAAFGVLLATGSFWVARGYTTVTATGSMAPSYPQGDRVVVERIGGQEVRRGDVVLFELPGRYGGRAVMQRVIGVGGDHVAFADGRLTVNGDQLQEPYAKWGGIETGTGPYDVDVPAGRMFLLGDDRGNSRDSRYFLSEEDGTVPTTAVWGRALDNSTAAVVLGLAVVLGVLCAAGGAVCLLVGWIGHRRRAVRPFAVGVR
jgi:signal peptidase I